MKHGLALIQPARQGCHSPAQQRILLYADELYRVPARYGRLRVVSGNALVTHNARDLILGPGRETSLRPGLDVALVSTLRGDAAVIELYGVGE